MEKLSMCRVCLNRDIQMKSMVETHLQEMYEILVVMPFKTEDNRPTLVCYICRAQLQNCYDLRRSCLWSEELFTQMLSCGELKLEKHKVNRRSLVQENNVVKLSIGDVMHMNADNVDVDTLTLLDVKVKRSDSEDIIEDALEENSVYDNSKAADSDDYNLIVVKEEHSRDRTCEVSLMYSEQAVQTSSDLKQHQLVQDKFKEVNKVTAAGKTVATSTNEVTFTLNDNNKERCTSVPHSKHVQYTCDTCQQCYTSKCKLESHIASCSQVFNKHLLRDNTRSGHKAAAKTARKPYQCSVCGQRCRCKSDLNIHMRTHTGEKPYRCEVCNRQFSLKSDLKTHIRTHTGEKPYHCDICNKQFSRKGTLSEHKRIHTGEKPYNCDICNKQISSKRNLMRHKLTHTGDKPYICDICGKQLARKENLSTHMRTHTTGEKPHCCDICKKQFSQKGSLVIHMQTHTGQGMFRCDTCGRQFLEKGSLVKHMRTHTGEKPYRCYLCNKQFSQKRVLVKHVLTHTGEKPYRCHLCNKQFRHNIIKSHLRTHTGEKPYQCENCNKQFRTLCALTKHVRIHTGEKPYRCDKCNKEFRQSSHLKTHMRQHF